MADTKERKLPAPAVSAETQAYWDAAAKGKLLVRKCTSCGQAHHYPRTICPFCSSDKTEWIEASGKGTIYSYSVMRRAPVPYAMAYVTRLRAAHGDQHRRLRLDKLKCEQPVKVVFKRRCGPPAADVHAGLITVATTRATGWPRRAPRARQGPFPAVASSVQCRGGVLPAAKKAPPDLMNFSPSPRPCSPVREPHSRSHAPGPSRRRQARSARTRRAERVEQQSGKWRSGQALEGAADGEPG